jgi:hypothetical protein
VASVRAKISISSKVVQPNVVVHDGIVELDTLRKP